MRPTSARSTEKSLATSGQPRSECFDLRRRYPPDRVFASLVFLETGRDVVAIALAAIAGMCGRHALAAQQQISPHPFWRWAAIDLLPTSRERISGLIAQSGDLTVQLVDCGHDDQPSFAAFWVRKRRMPSLPISLISSSLSFLRTVPDRNPCTACACQAVASITGSVVPFADRSIFNTVSDLLRGAGFRPTLLPFATAVAARAAVVSISKMLEVTEVSASVVSAIACAVSVGWGTSVSVSSARQEFGACTG